MPSVPATNLATATRFWMNRAGWGFLMGFAIAILDFAHYFPLAFDPEELGFISFLSLLLEWGVEGALLALTVGLAERWVSPRELRAWQLMLAVVIGAVVSVLVWQTFELFVLRDELGIRLFRDYLGVPVIWIRGVFYQVWLLLFFGGLGAAVFAYRQRRARMVSALHTAQLDRATSQQRLAEARLASLQACVDPNVLLQKLSGLEQSYEVDPDAADRLLDELIVFLRRALAEIRASGTAAHEPWNGDPPIQESGFRI